MLYIQNIIFQYFLILNSHTFFLPSFLSLSFFLCVGCYIKVWILLKLAWTSWRCVMFMRIARTIMLCHALSPFSRQLCVEHFIWFAWIVAVVSVIVDYFAVIMHLKHIFIMNISAFIVGLCVYIFSAILWFFFFSPRPLRLRNFIVIIVFIFFLTFFFSIPFYLSFVL